MSDTARSFWDSINSFLNICANWFEVFGFILMIITTIKVFFINKELKKLNSKHLLKERIKEHLKDLRSSSRNISSLLGNFNSNINLLRIEISKCSAYCSSLEKKTEKGQLPTLAILHKTAKRIKKNRHNSYASINSVTKILGTKPVSEADIDFFYETLSQLISELSQFEKDNNKSIL